MKQYLSYLFTVIKAVLVTAVWVAIILLGNHWFGIWGAVGGMVFDVIVLLPLMLIYLDKH